MSDEKIKTPKPEETVSKADYQKVVNALEVAKHANKDHLEAIANLESLREKDQEEMYSIKVSSEFIKNGGNDLYFDDFKKLTRGDKKVDYEALKMKYKVMFNQSTRSTGSPINQQTELGQEGSGRANSSGQVGVNMSRRNPNEWVSPDDLKSDS